MKQLPKCGCNALANYNNIVKPKADYSKSTNM